MGIFSRLKSALSKTRQAFSGIASLFGLRGRVDKEFLAQLEEKLYLADVGPAVPQIVERVRQAFLDKEISGEVMDFVKNEIRGQLAGLDAQVHWAPTGPTVIMVAGVNGSGKTTSIAKLAHLYQQQGKKVVLAACDTFRAAAVEQLTIWSDRLKCEIVKGQQGADPASVAHDGVSAALARKADVLIIDTAGRLHTQDHLMRELEKIRRVIQRQLPDAPHETLLILDATTGQNAIQQAQQFQKVVKCTGIVLTKLDGTAKGGAILSVKLKLNLPVKYIGVGETVEDLEEFSADAFVDGLFTG
ncbi:MAG TPA: signal recognition particle-docking protein FtsY [Gemmatales bacterium]|nr:signal recognition particle-docking protein FtsY [Gemmatales bacterium]